MVPMRMWNEVGGPGWGIWSIWSSALHTAKGGIDGRGCPALTVSIAGPGGKTHIVDTIRGDPVETLEKDQ